MSKTVQELMDKKDPTEELDQFTKELLSMIQLNNLSSLEKRSQIKDWRDYCEASGDTITLQEYRELMGI